MGWQFLQSIKSQVEPKKMSSDDFMDYCSKNLARASLGCEHLGVSVGSSRYHLKLRASMGGDVVWPAAHLLAQKICSKARDIVVDVCSCYLASSFLVFPSFFFLTNAG